jgi:hypothetical protein
MAVVFMAVTGIMTRDSEVSVVVIIGLQYFGT